MPKGVAGSPRCTPTARRAWLLFVVGAAVLSLVLTRAREPKPASTGDVPQPRVGFETVAAAETPMRTPTINTLPLTRVAEKGRMLVEDGRLGYDSKLDFVVTAELNEDGTLKPETVTFEWREAGDAEVVGLAQQFVTALSQSKLLASVVAEAKTVRLTGLLDQQNVTLGMEAEVASEARARDLAAGFNTLLLVARENKLGATEAPLYEALKAASDDNLFRLSFEMPKGAAAQLVAGMLDKPAGRNQY